MVRLIIFMSVPLIVHTIRNRAVWIVEYVKYEANDFLAKSSDYQFPISLSLTGLTSFIIMVFVERRSLEIALG